MQQRYTNKKENTTEVVGVKHDGIYLKRLLTLIPKF